MKHTASVLRISVLILLVTGLVRGQDALKVAELGDFRLESGQVIRECRVGYRTFGKLNQDKSNAVLITTYFTGTTNDLIRLIGPGKLLDSSKYFVIAVDAFGNGVSSSPSNSKWQPGQAFPQFSIRDVINAQHQLLTQELKLNHLSAVTGISMGGMQTFQWMVSYPEFMDKAIPIVGTPRQTSYDSLLWQTELRVIETARRCENGESNAMPIVSAISALALQTPDYLVTHVTPDGFQQFLANREKEAMRLNANDYARQLKAMIDHDIYQSFGGSAERAAAAVRARVLVVVAQQDHMVNPTPAQEFAKLLKAETLVLSGDCGHIAPSCESDKLMAAFIAFMSK